jgi:hypothetical protein
MTIRVSSDVFSGHHMLIVFGFCTTFPPLQSNVHTGAQSTVQAHNTHESVNFSHGQQTYKMCEFTGFHCLMSALLKSDKESAAQL